ncbi:CbtA family protein [Aeromicrobium stalagmiti]|uniref:CbtA family protein n=1 Tax=Aeromicrobium stalagmiti TaxID=2738988 RepID=UPI0015683A27|nr:CbtA family protein [Aeromicrobium stalagmiti]NRQ48656.1 CbtA family protein [Aeromicrobium stalagmiti]
MTPRNFLVRGLLAGFIASLFSFAVAYTVGEPQVDAAIAVEEANAAAPADATAEHSDGHSHSHADEDAEAGGTEVSREKQSTLGLATGILTVGTALGGVIGLASAFAVGRIGRLRPSQSTALVALVGYVSFSLVPFLKYPANPPAVGSGDTIGDRTLYYFIVQGIAILAAIVAVLVARRLLDRIGTYRTVLATAGGYLVVVIVMALAMPTVNELGDFPADTLWYFRLASLLTNVTLWAGIGIVLVGLIGRLYEQESVKAARRELAASL